MKILIGFKKSNLFGEVFFLNPKSNQFCGECVQPIERSVLAVDKYPHSLPTFQSNRILLHTICLSIPFSDLYSNKTEHKNIDYNKIFAKINIFVKIAKYFFHYSFLFIDFNK